MKKIQLTIFSFFLFTFIPSIQAQNDIPEGYRKVLVGPTQAVKSPERIFEKINENDWEFVYVVIDEGTYFLEDEIIIQSNNIILEGKGKVNFFVKKLYSNVMWVNGDNIHVKNIRMMHLNPGSPEHQNCSGRVIAFDNASNCVIENCDLNGCGLAGLHDNLGNTNILIKNCYIHNNSLGAYTNIDGGVWQEAIDDHPVFTFENNRIENNGPNRVVEKYEIKVPDSQRK